MISKTTRTEAPLSSTKPPAFLSYASVDEAFAKRLAADLKAQGANVWLDKLDIRPGRQWDLEVEKALTACSEVLVILSPASVDSPNVRDEWSFALRKGKTVIPVIQCECETPFRLLRRQYVDFRSDYKLGIKTLLEALIAEEQVILPSPSVSGPAATTVGEMPDQQEKLQHKRIAPRTRTPEPSRRRVNNKAELGRQAGLQRSEPTKATAAKKAGGSASSSRHVRQETDMARQAKLQRRKQANDDVANMKEKWRKRREKEPPVRKAEADARKAEAAARQAELRDAEFDRRFGVKTGGMISLADLSILPTRSRVFGQAYGPTPKRAFAEMLSAIPADFKDFVFVDFGSGLGRVLLLASEYQFRAIRGVEFSPDLHNIACDNIRSYASHTQKCKDIESICQEAEEYEIPAEKAIFYFDNPFLAPVMARVIHNIEQSLQKNPREAYLIYYNPIARNTVDRSRMFRLLSEAREYCVYRSTTGPRP